MSSNTKGSTSAKSENHDPRRRCVAHIDVINHLEFPGGEKIFPWALKLASSLAEVIARAHHARMPVVYVNNNFGCGTVAFFQTAAPRSQTSTTMWLSRS